MPATEFYKLQTFARKVRANRLKQLEKQPQQIQQPQQIIQQQQVLQERQVPRRPLPQQERFVSQRDRFTQSRKTPVARAQVQVVNGIPYKVEVDLMSGRRRLVPLRSMVY